jgi:hypothetical protein
MIIFSALSVMVRIESSLTPERIKQVQNDMERQREQSVISANGVC